MSWFDEDETRTHGGTISSGNAEENSDTPDEGSTIGGDLSEATEENGTGEFTGSENTDWFNEGEETEGSDDTEMKSEDPIADVAGVDAAPENDFNLDNLL